MAKPPKKTPRRRKPWVKTQELLDKVIEGLSEGQSLRSICEARDMPGAPTILRWVEEDAEFQTRYIAARQACADVYAEQILEIADEGHKTHEQVADAKVRIDARKWVAARMNPRRWGNKVQIGGADDLPPVKTNVNLAELSDAALEEVMSATEGEDA